ncbi:MAG TPA: ATP-binding protein [Gemmataceae bacterium]|nr:ATP-binding protein [Gemmataceae bacterium]
MLKRRLALAFLAPTALVSLALVGACIFGVLYLNHLHLDVAEDFSENRQSQQAAARLETTTREMLDLLRGDHTNAELFQKEVAVKNRELNRLLGQAEDLANRPDEKDFVEQISKGLKNFEARWNERHPQGGEKAQAEYALLAQQLERDVLKPSILLRRFNEGQEAESDQKNSGIVRTLKWVLLLVGLGAPLGGLLLGFALARGLHHSIYQLSVRIRDAAGRLNRDLGSVTLEEEGDFPGLQRQMQGVTEEIERIVTELQRREREVLHAEQLAAVGQVAAGVAHELRNPLTSIKMLVQTGLEGPAGLPPQDLTIIEREVRRMESCIQTFIDFARPPRCERRPTDLITVIDRSLTLIEGRARKQHVRIVKELPAHSIIAEIDPEQIQQVLVNLLLNALDALPQGGRICLSLKTKELSDSTTKLLEVSIQDTGKGIAPAIRSRLFEPFVSSKETGLGLGLSICKRLVEAHGGDIRGDNRDGGAVFAFTLPIENRENSSVNGSKRYAETSGR